MPKVAEMKEFIIRKIRDNGHSFGDQLPTSTLQGKYQFAENGAWVGGFWPGMNFLAYEMTRDKQFLDVARSSRARLSKRLYEERDTLDHDTGFLYSLSCVADYKMTRSEEAKLLALDAADLLLARYNQKGKFIQAWNIWREGDPEENKGKVIIDGMHNLSLLFWASEITGDSKYKEAAIGHANTCATTLIRSNYSTYHTYLFDPKTGEAKHGKTLLGYSDDSCWSRGQAWAIGGYAYAYKYTGNDEYLEIATKCAKLFLKNLEDDLIPLWDLFLVSKGGEPRDTSAAAIAASSLLELKEHVPEIEEALFTAYAKKIIESLFLRYSTKNIPNNEGILIHACGERSNNDNMDCSLIYGDYFFVEAVAKLSNQTVGYW